MLQKLVKVKINMKLSKIPSKIYTVSFGGFGVYSGIIGITGPGGINGKQRVKNKPVFRYFRSFVISVPSGKHGESRTLPTFNEEPLGN